MYTTSIKFTPENVARIKPEKDLEYSANWNGKLNCHFHTTIRLQKGYYKLGDYVRVIHKKEYSFKGLIRNTVEIFLHQLTEYTAVLDTGYSLPETKAILQKMYPDADWNTQKLVVLLIENIEWIP